MDRKRQAALARQTSTEDPVLRFLRLKDHLRTVDPLELNERIRQAVADGAGPDLLDALDGAPVGFGIALGDVVQSARDAIARRDDPAIGELAQLRDAYSYLLDITDHAVADAAEVDAVALADDAPVSLHDSRHMANLTQEVV